MSIRKYEGLIFDLGASEGNDTAFYLQKGFRVVAVEADPGMFASLQDRFAVEIKNGSVKLLHNAASNSVDETVEFYICSINQGVSGVTINADVKDHYSHSCKVKTIDWRSLRVEGKPYYVKIDIEGNEEKFLSGISCSDAPEFISVECHTLGPAQRLYDLGYRRFKLIDQNNQIPNANSRSGFRLADKQIEGKYVATPNFHHASGPFGLDVFGFGDWTNFNEFASNLRHSAPMRNHTWFDCHAWKPRLYSVLKLALYAGPRRALHR